jgi:sulfur carrier protein ThiS
MERMRRRSRSEETSIPIEPAAAMASASGSVQVIWGSMTESLELADMNVGDVFRMLRAPFNIAPAVVALVNGDAVDAEHRLRAGDELEFTRPAGEKGSPG